MAEQKRGSNAGGRNSDPNQDVQPWLGWIAAMLVVVIVVVAVAMGMERTSNQRSDAAEVRMTPLVGGIEVPLATEESAQVAAAAEVTPAPESATTSITDSGTVTMVTVITATEGMTATDTFTETGEMTPTLTMTATDAVSVTATITETETVSATVESSVPMTVTDEVAATVEPSAEVTADATDEPTDEPTAEADATEAVTSTATVEAADTPTPRPTSTPRPTATSASAGQVFDVGATLFASTGRVELHADVSVEAIILDSVGPGVELEVLPPSGDYSEYPVVVDGVGWVRVRAADGLVGWVQVTLVEEE